MTAREREELESHLRGLNYSLVLAYDAMAAAEEKVSRAGRQIDYLRSEIDDAEKELANEVERDPEGQA